MIKLDENYWIESDNLQFTLRYEENKGLNPKTGKDMIVTDQWYFPTLKMCLMAYINISTKKCKTIEDVLSYLSSIEARIENILLKRDIAIN